jgi:two-component system, OmpR family, aerobic respiration control sensor histidine kinase ArcB
MNKDHQIEVLKNKIASLKNEITLLQAKVNRNDNFENLLNAVINSIAGIHWWKDINGVYQGCNLAMVEALGLNSCDDIIGKTDYELPWANQADALVKNDKVVMDTDTVQKGKEEIVKTKDGNLHTFIVAKAAIKDKANHIIGTVGNSIDVTELKQTQKALELAKEKAEAANQAKTEFLENMRHDIRTPLTGIVGFAEALQSQVTDPKMIEHANDLVKSSNALLDFHNRVLEGLQVATGEIPLVKRKFDLRKQLEEIVGLNKSLASEKQLALNLVYDKTIPEYLIGDPIRVQRIVLELVANALRFTKQGGVNLIVSLKKKEEKQVVIEIRVIDSGIGISKDKQAEIFLRFKRLTPSYKGIYKGLGLGLTIVKQFIDDLDGEIYVSSELEKGSTFTCLISLKEAILKDASGVEETVLPEITSLAKKQIISEKTASQITVSLATVKNTILLVEDNEVAAKVAENALTDLNCTIHRAPDGKTAMELLQKHSYQLIFMDIGLPDTDGIALTYRIRLQDWQNSHATVPIIGLTAHIDANDKQKCLNAGMNMVILKPLKQEMAKELLSTFVQNESGEEITLPDTRLIKGAVLDFDEIKNTLRDEKTIEECRQLMITGLSEDLVKLADYYKNTDWKSIQAIAHKWRGGASYYGAKRLEQACKNFNDYWTTGQREQIEILYQPLIQEMETVKEVCITQQ